MLHSSVAMRGLLLLLFLLSLTRVANAQQKFTVEQLNSPQKFSKELENAFSVVKLPVYNHNKNPHSIVLTNGYAESEIKNKELWNGAGKTVDSIKIIFTNYPADKNFWLTDYHQLLAERLKALFTVDHTLNTTQIAYQLLLQTQCKTDSEARNMFHGIEIVFHYPIPVKRNELVTDSLITNPNKTTEPIAPPNAEAKRISGFINSNGGITDSTVIKILERHKEWKKALVVMDWTGSMYPYGGQAVLWHSLNLKTSGLKYFVFFNDGNNETRKKIGRTGGIYFERAENIKKLVNLLNKVKLKGNGGDTEENNLEAIIKGIQKYPDFSEVILIADNNSCIRDFCLIHEINVPVKIILCGTYAGINPQFLNLAYKTNGSVHTIEDDIYDLYTHKNSDAAWMIEGTEYRFNAKKDLFEYVTPPDKDDPHYCESFYKKKKCKCEKLK